MICLPVFIYMDIFELLNSFWVQWDEQMRTDVQTEAVTAVYRATATAAETTDLVVSDGITTVSIPSATYTSIADQATAIGGGTGYSRLLFTVAEDRLQSGASTGYLKMTYKAAGAIETARPSVGGAAPVQSVFILQVLRQ